MSLEHVPAVPVRYVVFSEVKGILLGIFRTGIVWSKSIPQEFRTRGAPTFINWAGVESYLNSQKYEGAVLPTAEHRLVEVWPDLPDNQASPTACANAALPAWETPR